MELKEATERLLEIRDRHSKNVKMLEESKVYLKNTAFEDVLIERKKDIEVIDTVLAELEREEYCIKCGDKIDEHELCEICVENKYRKSILTAREYAYIHIKECSKYKECKPECHFWGLCEDKAIPICNIDSAICVAEDIKEGVEE